MHAGVILQLHLQLQYMKATVWHRTKGKSRIFPESKIFTGYKHVKQSFITQDNTRHNHTFHKLALSLSLFPLALRSMRSPGLLQDKFPGVSVLSYFSPAKLYKQNSIIPTQYWKNQMAFP